MDKKKREKDRGIKTSNIPRDRGGGGGIHGQRTWDRLQC